MAIDNDLMGLLATESIWVGDQGIQLPCRQARLDCMNLKNVHG